MTFLKKLGQVLAQGIALATGVWPLVQGLFGSNAKAQQVGTTVVNDLSAIGQLVVQAEAMIQSPGSGAYKLESAAPLVANIVKTSELVSGHQIADEKLFIQGCTNITSGVAQVLNSLKSDGIKTTGSPLPSTPAPVDAPVPQTTAPAVPA